MKRAIFAFVFLTIVVASPPFYIQWTESQRLNRIQEMKQQARQIFGEPLEKILSELKKIEPPSAVILYTGNTKSHLEPCGCYQEQSGGLSRRAYAIEQIRQCGFPTFVVDAGNIFDGQDKIDMQRCQTNIKALAEMGYLAVALSPTDFTYDDNYLIQQKDPAMFPFLSPSEMQKDFTEPYVTKQAGQHTIAFVAGNVPKQAASEADVIVALGNPKELKHIDVVILSDEVEATKTETNTLYVGSISEGKTLGLLALWIDASGNLTDHHAAHIALTGEVGESELIRQLLTDFYQNTVKENAIHSVPLFADQELEKQNNEYISAKTCKSCHEQEYLQWSTTRHAFAYQTLLKKERYFDPNCVSCHTTGYGYDTGYQIGDQDSTLQGVQCETCHGPGKQHAGNPKKTNIRSGKDTSLCLQCHDATHSPGFAKVVKLHTKDVDHSREPMNLEELLASRIERLGKPTLELFVMSYCRFGIQAEENIIPIVKKFGDKIDFKLRFIAKEKDTVSRQDITPFTSLHGYPEVAENIRQLLIAREYPEQYLDYILCRGKKLNKSWEGCAKKLGIDVEKIQRLFDTPEAEQLFRENIKRSTELGIKASPTILVDNHKFPTNQLLRASGTPCQ
ncbi:MAG: multiheme c-type cytochrome [Candidatus Poribacteria bacterium]|nr:multiheme c-type cytochrome [Candidatus Poribacteria bacterium]